MTIEIPEALAEYIQAALERDAAHELYLAERAVRYQHNNAEYRMRAYHIARRAAYVFKKATERGP